MMVYARACALDLNFHLFGDKINALRKINIITVKFSSRHLSKSVLSLHHSHDVASLFIPLILQRH